ncbi:MAG: hypothetical protein WBY24_13360, partial [Candidatus Acidiferrales bacterium]
MTREGIERGGFSGASAPARFVSRFPSTRPQVGSQGKPALVLLFVCFPALTRWANFCRASGA